LTYDLSDGLSGPFAIDNRGLQTPNSGVLKIDHNFSNSDSLSARYLHGHGEERWNFTRFIIQGGSRFPHLERLDASPDHLDEILKPLTLPTN